MSEQGSPHARLSSPKEWVYRTIRPAAALVALLGLAATAAGKASASGLNTDLTFGFTDTQLGVGEYVRMNNDASITIATNPGTVECDASEYPNTQGFYGLDETNDRSTDRIRLQYAHGAIGERAPCSNDTPLGSDALVYVNPHEAVLALTGSKGKADIIAKSAREPINVEVSYSGGDRCIYTTSKLKGTMTVGGFTELDFPSAKLKLNKAKSAVECSKAASISMPFSEQSTDEFEPGSEYFIEANLVPQ